MLIGLLFIIRMGIFLGKEEIKFINFFLVELCFNIGLNGFVILLKYVVYKIGCLFVDSFFEVWKCF